MVQWSVSYSQFVGGCIPDLLQRGDSWLTLPVEDRLTIWFHGATMAPARPRSVTINQFGLYQSKKEITDRFGSVFHGCAQSLLVICMISPVLWVKASHTWVTVSLTCSALSNTRFAK